MTSGTTKSPDSRTTASLDTANVEGGSRYNALWWAKAQSAGPLQVTPDTPAVAGLTRAAEPDGRTVWMLPTLPDGAGHGLLEELGTPPVAVEQPNETARVLAICVTCCWPDRSGPAWPGVIGTLAQIKAVYAGLRGRSEQSSDLTLIIGSLRRLHATSWLIWNEKAGEVRLGPRVVAWGPNQLAGLREICRILPDPPRAVVVPAPRPPEVAPDELPDEHSPEGEAADSAEENVAGVGGAAYRMGVEDDTTGTGAAHRVSVEDNGIRGGSAYGVSVEDNGVRGGSAYEVSVEDNGVRGGSAYGDGVEDDPTGAGTAHGTSTENNPTRDRAAHGTSAKNNPTSAEAEHGASAEGVAIGGGAAYEDGVDR
jgi:hypothetical protein